jgi:hypothetical protein
VYDNFLIVFIPVRSPIVLRDVDGHNSFFVSVVFVGEIPIPLKELAS